MRTLVIGFARSGAAAAKLLLDNGDEVIVSDPKLDMQDATVQELAQQGVTFTTQQDESLLNGVDQIVKNPGIPYSIPILKAAQARHIPIKVEVALAQPYIKGDWIAVTGSNGKTTATEMIAAVLRTQSDDQHDVRVAGNIGTPVSEIAKTVRPSDTLVTELSSFQLLGVPDLKPKIAVITNIYASHLDYHGTRENYVAAKMNITKNQDASDFLVMNFDRAEWRELSQQTAAQVIPFSRTGVTQTGAYQQDDWLYYKDEAIMSVDQLGVSGDHNIENALMAIAVGRLQEIPVSAIKQALSEFTGVKHRLQKVGTYLNRMVYNDSKATDIEATESALSGFTQPIVLLAGGLDRGDDLMRLAPVLKAHVKQMIVFGQTANQLIEVAQTVNIPVEKTENVQTAVPLAFQTSAPGDLILLSPAAASWDQYPNFETRGDLFIQAVQDYAAAHTNEVK
ncbi:UDP-N-acetylmuramoylalanine--D-glutamate ligase [Weissella uvarum]|uniref:UDP-N-acetylmuramoyl-L-alanine--D-glutamate ligase n=1 Tax=Weissella uvarum TaxID=1479233 RepID=UPI00196017C1|nr:UDP-N-acetylmuramoyl-L-alanine--D-glutamate ligase [Weissella uvarum]MBM7617792.1 UDP-N-acetylmuramoylalanine--D-glutamate ligase [Weissella uvarum]MCM0595829.1 UDP-N-acetylmuramoyl-L-alanine--D-glutamate ligase [Weissella uvarum]